MPDTVPGNDAPSAPASQQPPSASDNLKNVLKKCGLVILGAGTGAEVLGKLVGSFEKVYHFFAEQLPPGWFLTIHQSLVLIVGAALICGYLMAAWWAFLKLRQRSGLNRVLYSSAAVTVLCVMAYANWLMIPEGPDATRYAREERAEWLGRVFANTPDNGGVPVSSLDNSAPTQVWTTAQVLRGAMTDVRSQTYADSGRVRAAFEYMEGVRLPGEQGWGYFEDWPFGVTEINAWVALAEVASLERPDIWTSEGQRQEMTRRVLRDINSIKAARQADGGWSPVIAAGPELSRTYSTVLAIWALFEARQSPSLRSVIGRAHDKEISGGVTWMLNRFRSDKPKEDSRPLGWVPNPWRASQQELFPGLEAQALYVISRITQLDDFRIAAQHPSYPVAVTTFLGMSDLASADIARNERLHDNDRYFRTQMLAAPAHEGSPESAAGVAHVPLACGCPITVEGSTFLWYPWSVAALQTLAQDMRISEGQRRQAGAAADVLLARLPEARPFLTREMNYVFAEFLIGVGVP